MSGTTKTAAQRKSQQQQRIKVVKKRRMTSAATVNKMSKGQKQIREKFKEIRKKSLKLKRETDRISKQSAANQLKLELMFRIVKARADNDSAKDAILSQALRELMTRQNLFEQMQLKLWMGGDQMPVRSQTLQE